MDLLEEQGYSILRFEDRTLLSDLASRLIRELPELGVSWPGPDLEDEVRVRGVERLSQVVAESGLIRELIRKHADPFVKLLGPDIDIQAVPHVRVSRPGKAGDEVYWHRDCFYGNTPWELNLWFPIFPLHEGAGLEILPGSHRIASTNVRPFEAKDSFQRSITKGSIANRIGYVYEAKIDDTISKLHSGANTLLLRPDVGEGIFFFGNMVHRGMNRSDAIRVSVDLRMRSSHTPTNTKPGYYVPALRGIVHACTEMFLARSRPSLSFIVPCLNEEGNLENTVRSLVAALEGTIDDYEILIFDDGSTDLTGSIADRLAREIPKVSAFHHDRNQGLGACFYGGIAKATKDYLMMIFGDNEIDPLTLRGLFIQAGTTDLVIPYLTNACIRPWHRQFISSVFTFLVNMIAARNIRYYNGPVLVRRVKMQGLQTRSFGFAYMAEIVTLLLGKGASYIEVPYTMQTRPSGTPKALRVKNLLSVARSLALMLRRRAFGGVS